MIDREMLDDLMAGDALAVMTRDRWGDYAHAPRIRFADEVDLPTLRAMRPDWRATSLAPVTLVEDVWRLPGIPDRSLDCLVALHALRDPDRVEEAFRAAARVLRAGGTMLLSVPDARFVADPGPDTLALHAAMATLEARLGDGESNPARPWDASRIVRLVSLLPAAWLGALEFEAVFRHGGDVLVAFALGGTGRHVTGAVVEYLGRVFVVDGRLVRHVQSPDVLAMVHDGAPTLLLKRGDYERMVEGPPMRQADVAPFLLRRDGDA